MRPVKGSSATRSRSRSKYSRIDHPELGAGRLGGAPPAALVVAMDTLSGFRVEDGSVAFVGDGLQRPACILIDGDGTLWVPDRRGGVVRILHDGSHRFIARKGPPVIGSIPNGITVAPNGDLIVADFGRGVVEVMTRQGHCRMLYEAVDGRP